MIAERISRVRCVLARNNRYLLVQHNNRLPENFGKWGLPGGGRDIAEEPTTGLRRELAEEFQIDIGDVVLLGDWEYRDEPIVCLVASLRVVSSPTTPTKSSTLFG